MRLLLLPRIVVLQHSEVLHRESMLYHPSCSLERTCFLDIWVGTIVSFSEKSDEEPTWQLIGSSLHDNEVHGVSNHLFHTLSSDLLAHHTFLKWDCVQHLTWNYLIFAATVCTINYPSRGTVLQNLHSYRWSGTMLFRSLHLQKRIWIVASLISTGRALPQQPSILDRGVALKCLSILNRETVPHHHGVWAGQHVIPP